MLKIGEFSKLSRLTVRRLRSYDEAGLLRPASIDPFTGYRYYSESNGTRRRRKRPAPPGGCGFWTQPLTG